MLEVYTDVTELLRHFYATLHRTGAGAAVPGNAAASKAEAILQRLVDVSGKSLEARKRQSAEQYISAPDKKEASTALINGILVLIQRANVTWGMFQNS